MYLPYFTTSDYGVVKAKENPDGTWQVQGTINNQHIPAKSFRQMFSPKHRDGLCRWGKSEPSTLDPHHMVKDGSRSVEILFTKDEVRKHHADHPETDYIDKHGHVMKYSDFPLGWAGFTQGERIETSERNEVWSLPLIALYQP